VPKVNGHTERVRLSHDRANESGKAKAVDNFRGVTFDNWLQLFMQARSFLSHVLHKDLVILQYAFLLTKRGKYELADEVLSHILISNAYMDRRSQDTLRLGLIGARLCIREKPATTNQCSLCYSRPTVYCRC
jgi:general transcription factor 3C polypeptide 3 (transcription factor C subunit 4)